MPSAKVSDVPCMKVALSAGTSWVLSKGSHGPSASLWRAVSTRCVSTERTGQPADKTRAGPAGGGTPIMGVALLRVPGHSPFSGSLWLHQETVRLLRAQTGCFYSFSCI